MLYENTESVALTELDKLQRNVDMLRMKLIARCGSEAPSPNDKGMRYRIAKEIFRSRKRRNALFGKDLAGEPGWDILLELYMAEFEQRKVSVSGACYASEAPFTTALRWLERLEGKSWLGRTPDARDGRRFWVNLTDDGIKAMDTFLDGTNLRSI